MPETTPLIKAALNLRGGAGFDVYEVREKLPASGNVHGNIMDKDTKGRPRNGLLTTNKG